ncbi:MAG: hypothetical protein SFV22_09265 [Saprospiraceae bacterium]|nr:hypothetical protein [Saprospiraceae bacterium]
MNRQLFLCCFFLAGYALYAQRPPVNTVYIEALGLAGYHSFNYERVQYLNENHTLLLGGNLGLGLLRYDLVKGIALPFRLHLCAGKRSLFAELGLDYLIYKYKVPSALHPGSYNYNLNYARWFIHAGARYQPKKDGLFLRAYVFPIETNGSNGSILYIMGEQSGYKLNRKGIKYAWWGGLSMGWTF